MQLLHRKLFASEITEKSNRYLRYPRRSNSPLFPVVVLESGQSLGISGSPRFTLGGDSLRKFMFFDEHFLCLVPTRPTVFPIKKYANSISL